MLIKQLSIFIENKAGRLADITAALAEAGIDIRALSVADTADFGILRLIVDHPDRAERALREKGVTVSLNDVIAIGIPDRPGGFAAAVHLLSDAGIGVEYMYAFVSREEGRACVILRVEDNDRAIAVLTAGDVQLLRADILYKC